MLEINNKKVTLWYRFDSRYADDEYEKFDDDEFIYEITVEDAKEVIAYNYLKITENNDICSTNPIIAVLDEMDDCEEIDWGKIIEKNEDVLMEEYKTYAMEYFVRDHYIMTKDAYDEIQDDRRRCEE